MDTSILHKQVVFCSATANQPANLTSLQAFQQLAAAIPKASPACDGSGLLKTEHWDNVARLAQLATDYRAAPRAEFLNPCSVDFPALRTALAAAAGAAEPAKALEAFSRKVWSQFEDLVSRKYDGFTEAEDFSLHLEREKIKEAFLDSLKPVAMPDAVWNGSGQPKLALHHADRVLRAEGIDAQPDPEAVIKEIRDVGRFMAEHVLPYRRPDEKEIAARHAGKIRSRRKCRVELGREWAFSRLATMNSESERQAFFAQRKAARQPAEAAALAEPIAAPNTAEADEIVARHARRHHMEIIGLLCDYDAFADAHRHMRAMARASLALPCRPQAGGGANGGSPATEMAKNG